MGNRHCPKCGEDYSDTYRTCPFCEEEEAIRKGRPLRRRGGRRVEKRQRGAAGGAGGVMMLLTGVIILGVLAFVFFGDQIAGTIGIRTDADVVGEDANPEEQTPPAETDSPTGTDAPAQADPPADSVPADGAGDSPDAPADPAVPAEPLSLSQSSMTIAAGETARLTATGGGGDIIWTTSNENVAAVDGGSVTGKAGGTATITAASGAETASCAVTITGTPYVSNANLSLNKTDFTFRSGDPDVTLKVKGTENPAAWASANTSVATVSESGVVKWAGKGTTTVTATVDGQVLECIVRAK